MMWKKIKSFFKKFSIGEEAVSQYQPDPNNKYACLFTCYFMAAKTLFSYKKSWHEYKRDAVAAKVLRDDFFVLSHEGMVRTAAGKSSWTARKVTKDFLQEIFASVLNGRPVVCSLNGEHWVNIDGWQTLPDDNDYLFTVDDPARAGEQVFIDSSLQIFSPNEKNVRVYQKTKNGARRKVTTIVLIERT